MGFIVILCYLNTMKSETITTHPASSTVSVIAQCSSCCKHYIQGTLCNDSVHRASAAGLQCLGCFCR